MVHGGLMSWFVVVHSGSWWFIVPPPLTRAPTFPR